MPEGHVIHRLAGDVGQAFAGHVVLVASPQGRFAREAAELDGSVLLGTEAYGKHLFVSFGTDGARVVHIHLGLIGRLELDPPGGVWPLGSVRPARAGGDRWSGGSDPVAETRWLSSSKPTEDGEIHWSGQSEPMAEDRWLSSSMPAEAAGIHRSGGSDLVAETRWLSSSKPTEAAKPTGPLAPAPPPSPSDSTVRLRIANEWTVAILRGPQTCELLTPAEADAVVARLGPDPIRADADPDRGWQRMRRSSRSVAALLMDQRVAAGVGNIYRAEVLFRQRLDPLTPGRDVSEAVWGALWADLATLMAQGGARGRIDTVRPEHDPAVMGREPRVDPHGGEVYVYRREGQPCLVCGTPIRAAQVDARRLYWCPSCQR